jgi:hypothetical protein
MRRSVLALLAGGLFSVGLVVGCASPKTLEESGTGGSGSGQGGNGSATGGTTGSGSGGSSPTGNGGSVSSTGGSGAPTCTPNPSQLVSASAYNCDQSSIGIEGSIYPYGDGASCPYGPSSPSANICTSAGCCLGGTTVVDATFAKWGCGIGLELDDDGTTKNVYTGPVKCFMVTLTGSSGGNVVRIGFTQSATPASGAVAPYTELPAFTNGWSGQVCFADATCPGWATTAQCTTNNTPVDMQIQVSAGSTTSTVGTYNISLTSVVPVQSGSTGTGGSGGGTSSCSTPSGSGTLSGQYDTAHVGCPKDYLIQNNDWGVSSASQTITYGPGTKFKVTNQGGTGQNGAPASYPDIFTGANSGHSTAGSGLPLAVSSISATGIQTSWSWDDSAVNASGSSYNATYDVWFSTGSGGDPSLSAPSGGYLMVWYYKPSDNQPIGSTITNGTVTIGGKQFNIWYGTNNGKPVVSYVAQQKMTSWTFSLGAFIQDAASRTCSGSTKCLQSSWYLTNVFSGFEIWKGGVGLQTTDFGVTVP